MIIVVNPKASKKTITHIMDKISKLGLKPWISRGVERSIIGIIGKEELLNVEAFKGMDGVEEVLPILKPYKLASLEHRSKPSEIPIGNGIVVGGKKIIVMAGPCSVEGKAMIIDVAKSVKKSGAVVLRGGAFKPRTNPYSFQGLGAEGLEYLLEAKKKTGLLIVSEIMDVRNMDLMTKYADIVQIGARNMQNFDLLKEAGKIDKPVLLKRGMSNTIKELLMSAEYILAGGNPNVMLCERGVRTFEDFTRFTLDINAVPAIKSLSHLPVIVDPSHATGRWGLVESVSRAAVAAGADGLIIEVHPKPEDAFSDGNQSLLPKTFDSLMKGLKKVAKAVGREI
ncbi:MAG TPA: 3-deoxy-7-phosphoheptulonate synthase [Candidatus Omnitrophota bacterium]|nr:3-deoxy-7-phosphoheptulonate synthase [Candidatus Omnitrophota bacterium]HPS19877.1 3-deoxy-7-phosphoheptulonate synthase [Candidatus Omnitrophota bacterium]